MTETRVAPRRRREYLDWLRGVAVLLMIEAHLLDSWTREQDRHSDPYTTALMVGGMGTPLFLLLAGTAAALSAGSKARRLGDAGAATRAVARRGLDIFLLAFLFRFQAWVLGWSSEVRDLLKVDILNVMGPSIVFAALLWRAASTVRGRCAVFVTATALTAFMTPIIRTVPFDSLPAPLRGYVVPVEGLSQFVFFPWMGFVFAGALIGVLIDAAPAGVREHRLNVALATGGAALVFAAHASALLPPPFWTSGFWTSSPAYFFMRAGLVAAGIGLAYAWTERFTRADRWSPVIQLGRTSLFIYWIHVELVYGLVSLPLHKALTVGQAFVAYGLFTGFMLICSLAKDRVVGRYRHARRSAEATV